MRVAVFCSSSTLVENKYFDFAYDMGKAIAEQGWGLVWGGGQVSMMGAVSRGARSSGGETIGVIPQRLVDKEFEDDEATEMYVVPDMRVRKGKMDDLSDAFIILPGGLGTFEEFFEIWVGRHLGFHHKPITICDPFNTYSALKELIHQLKSLGFVYQSQEDLINWCTDIPTAIDACKPVR
jgi:uncharacterized protein (TIGR00730 family)